MSAWPVLVNGALVAFEVALVVLFPNPITIACLVFTALMFVWTLVMSA